jgi:hypothetical protein
MSCWAGMPSAAKAVLILDSYVRPKGRTLQNLVSQQTVVRRSSKGVELLKGTGFRPYVNLPNDTRF